MAKTTPQHADMPLDLVTLEAAAASAHPSPSGAHWTTQQAIAHLLHAAGSHDPATGAPTWRSLTRALEDLLAASESSAPAFPSDEVQQILNFTLASLEEIVARPRTRLVRDHVVVPLHRLRETDSKTLAWMSRLPGRTAREKLGTHHRALGVQREFLANTPENRLARWVLTELLLHAERRLEHRAASPSEHDSPDSSLDPNYRNYRTLKRVVLLGRTLLLRSPLSDVPPSPEARANNTLLGDRHYAKVLRAWGHLRDLDRRLLEGWNDVPNHVGLALFWGLVAELQGRGGRIEERLCRIGSGRWELQKGRSGRLSCTVLFEHDYRVVEGQVAVIVRNGGKPFGFIKCGKTDYYFNGEHLAPGGTLEDFPVRTWVYFLREEGPKPAARQVHLAPHASRAIRISYDKGLLRVDEAIIRAGAMPYRWRQLLRPQCTLNFQKPNGPRRGLQFEVQEQGASIRQTRTTGADVQGIAEQVRGLADRVHPAAPSLPPPSSPGLEIEHLGIDAGMGRYTLADGSTVRHSLSAAHALHLRDDDEVAYWMPGHEHRLPDFTASGVEAIPVHHLGTTCNASDGKPHAPGDIALAVHHSLSGLASEFPILCEVPSALAVPDTLDEVGQRVLRAEAAAAFLSSIPVWRSVAAALGWQSDWKRPPVKAEDTVLVLDATDRFLGLTLLTAKHDPTLERKKPSTGGIVWERRPPLIPDEAAHSLGTADLFRAVATDLVDRQTPKGAEFRPKIVDALVQTGLVEKLAFDGRPVALPMEDVWIQIAPDAERVHKAMQRWQRRFETAIAAWADDSPLLEGLRERRREAPRSTLHLLLVGRLFANFPNPGELERALQRLPHRFPPPVVTCLDPHNGTVARGAAEVVCRVKERLPTWREWIPDLHAEVARGGHFSTVQLLASRTVNPLLGEPITHTLPERLVLHPGPASYRIPVLSGTDGKQPTPSLITLHSTEFPLTRPCPIRVTFTYRYGFDDGHGIEVRCEGDGGPRITARWEEDRPRAIDADTPLSGGPPAKPKAPPPNGLPATLRKWEQDFAHVFQKAVNTDSEEDAKRAHSSLNTLLRNLRGWPPELVSEAATALFQSSTGQALEAIAAGRFPGQDPSDPLPPSLQADLSPRASEVLCALGQASPEWKAHLKAVLRDWRKKSNIVRLTAVDATRALAAAADEDALDAIYRTAKTELLFAHNTSLYNAVVAALGTTGIENPQALKHLVQADPQAATHLVRMAEYALERLAQNVPRAIRRAAASDDAKKRVYLSPFENACLLLLAASGVRESAHTILLTGGDAALHLAKLVRYIDGLFAEAGWTVKTPSLLRLLPPPAELVRMSRLAYATVSYLVGEAPHAAITVSD